MKDVSRGHVGTMCNALGGYHIQGHHVGICNWQRAWAGLGTPTARLAGVCAGLPVQLGWVQVKHLSTDKTVQLQAVATALKSLVESESRKGVGSSPEPSQARVRASA